MFFEILTRETPWAKELKGEVPFARVPSWVLDGRRPQYGTVDAGLAGVMISCWKQKPNERPSLGQILEMLEAESPVARAKTKAAADAAAKAAADAEAKAAADAAAKAAASKAAAGTSHLQQRHVRVCSKCNALRELKHIKLFVFQAFSWATSTRRCAKGLSCEDVLSTHACTEQPSRTRCLYIHG